MSNTPKAIFFDTGPLISLFNKSEKTISDAVLSHVHQFPHTARLVVTPCLVELFYKLRKIISPNDVNIALAAYNITLFSEGAQFDKAVFSDFCKIDYKQGFDFADYYLCRSAYLLPSAQIITIDQGDFLNAFGRASGDRSFQEFNNVQIIPFGANK